MKFSDIKGKDSRELQLDAQALRKELFEMRLKAPEEIQSPARFRQIRQTVARIETVLRERELAAIGEQNGGKSS